MSWAARSDPMFCCMDCNDVHRMVARPSALASGTLRFQTLFGPLEQANGIDRSRLLGFWSSIQKRWSADLVTGLAVMVARGLFYLSAPEDWRIPLLTTIKKRMHPTPVSQLDLLLWPRGTFSSRPSPALLCCPLCRPPKEHPAKPPIKRGFRAHPCFLRGDTVCILLLNTR